MLTLQHHLCQLWGIQGPGRSPEGRAEKGVKPGGRGWAQLQPEAQGGEVCLGLELSESGLRGTSGELGEAGRKGALPYETEAFLNSPGLHPGAAWQRNSGPRMERGHVVSDPDPRAPTWPCLGPHVGLGVSPAPC